MKVFLTKIGVFKLCQLSLGLSLSWLSHECFAQDWLDSRAELARSAQDPQTSDSAPWWHVIKDNLVGGLRHPENFQKMHEIHSRLGSKVYGSELNYLGPGAMPNPDSATAKKEIATSFGSGISRNLKAGLLPESLKQGLRFEIGGSTNSPLSSGVRPRYGLILQDLEPSPETMKFAALAQSQNEDFELVAYAPKASSVYTIGLIQGEDNWQSAPAMSLGSETEKPVADWFAFQGKLVAKGLPSSGQILPTQVLTLEQKQSFYAFDWTLFGPTQGFDALLHRWKVPLAGAMVYREEWSGKGKVMKRSLENLYRCGPLSMNLDHIAREKRWQSTWQLLRPAGRIEFVQHLPEANMPLGKAIRFELKLLSVF